MTDRCPFGKTWKRFDCRLAVAVTMVVSLGCQQKMASQPSYKPLQPSTFFEDGRASRPLVPGTVARGYLQADRAYATGRTDGTETPPRPNVSAATDAGSNPTGAFDDYANFIREFPIPINESVLRHGYHRYAIYCSVCHDALGTGQGKIVERGYTAPPSYHIDRLRQAPVGRLFAIITHGYGSMPAYKNQISIDDRWAIVAYLRALQISQHFPEEELTPAMREQLAAKNSEVDREEVAGPKEERQ